MITLVEALGYRCLRYISQPLGPFHVLVGPNASGKTTFLDVIAFLGRLASDGIEAAVEERTQNFYDLLWQRSGHRFELAIEARIPEALRGSLTRGDLDTVRYEIALGIDPESQELGLQAERVLLIAGEPAVFSRKELFPEEQAIPDSLLAGENDSRETRTIINKVPGGNDNFYAESGDGWVPVFKLGPRRSALSNLPADESKFPVSTWLRELLATGVQQLVLNSLLLRKASPPGQSRSFKPDGSNLPWVIADLERRAPERLQQWIAHLQTAFPDIQGIQTIERPEDKHRYLLIRYRGGVEIPSWMVSDGTLRMLALTLPAYLTGLQGVYLIEEPENGIHPRAIELTCHSEHCRCGAGPVLREDTRWCYRHRARERASRPGDVAAGDESRPPFRRRGSGMSAGLKDLAVLIADKNMEGALRDFLRTFAPRYAHGLVVFDREGIGQEAFGRSVLEQQVESRLSSAGWDERAAAVVIDPELEIWVWNESPHVEAALGWDAGDLSLKDWLRQKGWLPEGMSKPIQPKRAVEEALRISRKPRSSSVYHQLAQKVSVDRCVDPSFLRLREILIRWFSR